MNSAIALINESSLSLDQTASMMIARNLEAGSRVEEPGQLLPEYIDR